MQELSSLSGIEKNAGAQFSLRDWKEHTKKKSMNEAQQATVGLPEHVCCAPVPPAAVQPKAN